MTGTSTDVRSDWLAAQVDRLRTAAPAEVVEGLAEALSLATGEAVTVRRLAADGRSLVAVAVHHPDAGLRAAMREVVHRTSETRSVGLWRDVLDEVRTVVFPVPSGGAVPAAASGAQREFLARWPVRVVAGTPALVGGTVVGGVSLVRFVHDEPFSVADLALLEAVAAAVAGPLALVG